MKYKDIEKRGAGELDRTLKDLRIRLGQLYFDLGSKALKDSSQIKKVKTDIARVMTALSSTKSGELLNKK